MLVFWEPRLVFLATPKAGSTAIEAALESLAEVSILRPPALKHTTAGRYQRFFRPFLEKASGGASFTVVALMREPLDWLGSWYRYRTRGEIGRTDRATGAMSFDDFLLGYLEKPRPAFADVGSQARFLGQGAPSKVDHIFRYERIDTLVSFLEERLECEITLPRLNVSPEAETRAAPEIEARLRAECIEDFALYDRVCADERR